MGRAGRERGLKAGELLSRTLESCGVTAAYGDALSGLDVVAVREAEVASLLARAHKRIHGKQAAIVSGRTLRFAASSSRTIRKIAAPGEIVDLVREAVAEGLELEFDVDLEEPTDLFPPGAVGVDRWSEPSETVVEEIRKAETVTVLCGPGVVASGVIWGLHDLASAGGLGVLNTWGAKGVFDWRSHHHFATAGLQREDFALGGLAEADLVIATGVDTLEAPPHLWSHFQHVSVEPTALARLAELWPAPRNKPVMPPLRDRLSVVTQSGWTESAAPIKPSRATLSYSRVFGTGGLVASDPGVAGYWVARTFATREIGSVQVPAEPDSSGLAAAICLVARLANPNRPVLCVIDAPVDDHVQLVVDAASGLGVRYGIEVWDGEGDRLDAESHEERLASAATGELDGIFTIATDPSQLDEMVEAAGPVVAWKSA